MLYILAGSTSPPTINTGTAGSRRSRDRHQPGEQHASRLEVLPPTSASNHPNATRWWCRYKAQTPAEDLVEARKETGRDQGHNSRPPACHHTPTALNRIPPPTFGTSSRSRSIDIPALHRWMLGPSVVLPASTRLNALVPSPFPLPLAFCRSPRFLIFPTELLSMIPTVVGDCGSAALTGASRGEGGGLLVRFSL